MSNYHHDITEHGAEKKMCTVGSHKLLCASTPLTYERVAGKEAKKGQLNQSMVDLEYQVLEHRIYSMGNY